MLPTSRFDALVPNTCIENFLYPNPQLGYRFEKRLGELKHSKKITVTQETMIQKKALQFLICLCKELMNCL